MRFCYDNAMKKQPDTLSPAEVLAARERRLEMQHLQAIEGNPLDAEDIAMFEMFERERWSHERRLAYILEDAKRQSATQAAE